MQYCIESLASFNNLFNLDGCDTSVTTVDTPDVAPSGPPLKKFFFCSDKGKIRGAISCENIGLT